MDCGGPSSSSSRPSACGTRSCVAIGKRPVDWPESPICRAAAQSAPETSSSTSRRPASDRQRCGPRAPSRNSLQGRQISRLVFCVHPFFSDTTRVQIGGLFQFRQSPADGLGIALQHAEDVLDTTMTQLCGLDGGIPSTIVLGQRVVQALHHPFDSRCVGVHVTLLLVALRSKDLIPYFKKIGKLFT